MFRIPPCRLLPCLSTLNSMDYHKTFPYHKKIIYKRILTKAQLEVTGVISRYIALQHIETWLFPFASFLIWTLMYKVNHISLHTVKYRLSRGSTICRHGRQWRVTYPWIPWYVREHNSVHAVNKTVFLSLRMDRNNLDRFYSLISCQNIF